MEAASFDEANLVLGPPPGMTEEQVGSLSVWRGAYADGRPVVISCFKVTKEELEEINRTGRVWLHVFGVTMPPVWLGGRNPFTSEDAT